MNFLYERFKELSQIIKNASAERDEMKEKEILPAMLDGEVFGDDTHCLVIELSESVKFDYKQARKDGRIDDQTWKDYTQVDIISKLVARQKNATDRELERQKNLRLAASPDLERHLEELVAFADTYMSEEGKALGGGVAIAGALAALDKAKNGVRE